MSVDLNKATYTDDEHRELLAWRARLLDRKFDGALSGPDILVLERIRWALDRVEAQRGHSISAVAITE